MECERRFLLTPAQALMYVAERGYYLSQTYQEQGYIVADPTRTVRVRLEGSTLAYLTLKGKKDDQGNGEEIEGEIPLDLARQLLGCSLCLGTVAKWRYSESPHNGLKFSLDVFLGANEGLTICEVEGEPAQVAAYIPPFPVEKEITTDHAYSCSQLAQKPYSQWETKGKETPTHYTPPITSSQHFDDYIKMADNVLKRIKRI